MICTHIENVLDAFEPVTLSRNTKNNSPLYKEVNYLVKWSFWEAKRRLGHNEDPGKTRAETVFPYVDPRILVDFVHKWKFSRQQFQQIRTFSKHAGWLSDSEEEDD